MSDSPTQPSPALRVSLVIPTLNEEATIADVIAAAAPHVDEVLVVDGHSRDTTREIAATAGARVCVQPGKGKGDAIRYALTQARGEVVVFMDADGSHEPSDIPRLVAPALAGDADLVVGCRMTGGSDELHGDIPKFLRLIGSEIITIVINYRWRVQLTDVQNGFRALRRDIGLRLGLRENNFAIEEEMVMKALRQGYRVRNVSSHEYERRHGQSRIVLRREWFSFVWCVLKHIVGWRAGPK
ncbi:MAG: glycosyltransferase family 2 protein [Armatimonadetes bacterium]|nr:glycosyltransferase family 2 protein [Armatimonadota bacterium]